MSIAIVITALSSVISTRCQGLFRKLGANVKIVIIDTPKEICKERRKDCIPEKVIDDMELGKNKVKNKFKNNKDTVIITDRY